MRNVIVAVERSINTAAESRGSTMTNFFLVSGVIFWIIIFLAVCGVLAYLIVKDIPEPKGKTLNLTGYRRYGKDGRLIK